MGRARRRQSQQQRRSLERRRAQRAAPEREVQQLQALAATPTVFGRWRRRRVAAYTLWGVAVVLAISHFFEHSGMIRLMTPGLEDLAIGWPMAFVVAVAGYVLYNR